MSWEDILKKPYDVGAYDENFDSYAEEQIDNILKNKFDDLSKKAQIKTKTRKYSVLMDNNDYEECLRAVRGSKPKLTEVMKELYNVKSVQIVIGDKSEKAKRRLARKQRMGGYDVSESIANLPSIEDELVEEWTKDVEGWEESGRESIIGAIKVVFTKL
tara:strand:- start:950 stop:1426 length:477 start_codon:yes stop_codon:yes gene_type:complete